MSNLSDIEQTSSFETLLDFWRYGVTKANITGLHYGHGTDNAFDDIKSLLLGMLSLPFNVDDKFLQTRLTLDEKQLLQYALTERIDNRVPVPYLINEAYFCDLPFYVDERVLIPRSPIAELIERQFSPWIEADNVTNILDLCTGSGCIAIACAYAFEEALVDAVDLSPDALEVAAHNVNDLGVSDSVNLIESNLWHLVPQKQYDIIVSNPPYVSSSEMQILPDEYRHEPVMALETGNEGLAIVDEILAKADQYLSPQGILVVEVGNSMEALIEAYPTLPFTWLIFERGGDGVFVLTCQQLKEFHNKR